MGARQRLAPEVRRRQIAEAAKALLLEQGYLPLAIDRVATRVGVSKGLIYGYFPTQQDLFNAIVAEEMAALGDAGLLEAATIPALEARAIACAEVYIRRIATHGPVLHYILRDAHMAGSVEPAVVAMRDRLWRGFARQAMRELGLPPDEAVAVVGMTAAIPEEVGRLTWQGELTVERACELDAQLIASAIKALRPA